MKISLLLLMQLSMDSNIVTFNSIYEFNSYIEVDSKSFVEIYSLKQDSSKYYYAFRENQILYFDYSLNNGYACEFDVANKALETKGVNLREMLARQEYGIEHSRSNYLNFTGLSNPNKLLKLAQNEYKILNTVPGVSSLSIDSLMSDRTLSILSDAFNKMEREEVMKYEIPLLILFSEYAKLKHGNRIRAEQMHNVFKEEYFGIAIIFSKKLEINLSDRLTRILFPRFGFDDYEKEEDAIINLRVIKEMIDYYNSNKVFKI